MRANRRPPRPGPGPAGSNRRVRARDVALRVIRRVTEEGAYSNLALGAELDRSGLDPRDRQFAADLVYGTLRRRIPIDHELAGLSTRPLDRIDPAALAILRLGMYQLRFTRVAPHAAVSETVGLAAAARRGFVNAILRAAASARPPVPEEPAPDDPEAVSVSTGLAAWAISELARVLPAEEVLEAARALAAPAGLTLRTNTCRTSPEALAERLLREAGHQVAAGRHHPDALSIASGRPSRLPGFGEGWFTVQDEASVLVAGALGTRPGERILDVCAGPGGKAVHLACLAGRDGCVVASDVAPRRAGLVRATAARLGLPVLVLAQDGRTPALSSAAPFDAALVDAPCSGLGAARRRPELLWRSGKECLSGLARLQVAILAGTADLVRPGGRIVYSVCTFPRAETEAAARAFLARRPDFSPLLIPGPDGPAATHRLWPHRHGTDAMFFAGFRRNGDGGG